MNEKILYQYKQEIDPVLLNPHEEIIEIYGLLIDFAAITNLRFIFVDKSFLGKKRSLITIPFSKISSISMLKNKGVLINTFGVEISVGHQHYELSFLKEEDLIKFYNQLTKLIL